MQALKKYFLDLWNINSDLVLEVAYNLVLAIIVLIAMFIIVKMVRHAIRKIPRLDETLIPILSTTASYAIYLVALVIILDIFGFNTTSLIALLGAAGIAVGLALKDTLSNIASGIMLLLLRPFKKGDAIKCNAVSGVVEEINLFASTIYTFDGLYVSVPNGILWSSAITNFSKNGKRRMDIIVGIGYGDSIDRGLEVLRTIIEEDPRFLTDPAPQTMVSSLGDSSVNLEMRAWTTTSDYWDVFWEKNKLVKERIEAAGLSIPFPQRDCHIINDDAA